MDHPGPETCTAPAEIVGIRYELTFACELAGAIQGRGRLMRYVCDQCRQQNARGRNEWESSTFPDDMQPDALERAEAAFKEVQAHVHMHEIIGEWMMREIERAEHGK
jgi:hypothetical protein